MADLSVGMVASELQETATLRLWQCGEYVEDGICYRIGPVISQAFLDATGSWVFGLYNALDPTHCSSCDGTDDEHMERIRQHALALVRVSGGSE